MASTTEEQIVEQMSKEDHEAEERVQTVLDLYPNLEALLEVNLPCIAILAEKEMTFSSVLSLDVGSVIVFPKHNSDPIPLLINNQRVGAGKTIKVGDHFGLHLRSYSQQAVVNAVT